MLHVLFLIPSMLTSVMCKLGHGCQDNSGMHRTSCIAGGQLVAADLLHAQHVIVWPILLRECYMFIVWLHWPSCSRDATYPTCYTLAQCSRNLTYASLVVCSGVQQTLELLQHVRAWPVM